jgi:hypothetical protein
VPACVYEYVTVLLRAWSFLSLPSCSIVDLRRSFVREYLLSADYKFLELVGSRNNNNNVIII